MEGDKQGLNLKREVGITGAVSFIAGTMIGSGIFMSPQYVLSTVGSPGASLIIWACCGLIAMLGGLCYAELGTVIPESGAEYVYMLRTAGKVVAFVFIFSFIIVMRPASATAIALSLAEYVVALFYGGCTPPQLIVKCVAAGSIMLLAIVNCVSVRLATGIQVLSMVGKVLALAVIALGGVVMLVQGNTQNFDNSFEGSKLSVNAIGFAFYQGLWSYDGWNTLNYLTEELKHPESENLSRSSPVENLWFCKYLVATVKAFEEAGAAGTMEGDKQGLNLKREVGITGAVSFIAGTMIGSGIFMSPQYVLSTVGSPGASLIIWACCGLIAMLGGLCYAELGTVIPESGAEYVYMLRTAGKVVAFVFIFNFITVRGPTSAAALALTVAEYVVAPFYGGCTPPQLTVKCVAAGSIVLLTVVNCLSVRLATGIQVACTVAKVLALAAIALGGVAMLIQGNTQNFDNSFEGTQFGISSMGIASYQGLWSYGGWGTLNYLTEELKDPEVNLPRAIVIAISLVTGLYLLVNVSYLTVLTPRELMTSTAVAVTWGNKVLGSWGWIMSVAAALSAFGSLNGTFFSGGRVCFVAAREGHMPDILAMAHVHRLTPSPALIFTAVVSLVVLIPGDFQSIVNFFSFTAWFFYAVTLSGLLYLKIRKPELPRPYTVPIIIPILVLLAAIFLVLAPIVDDPQIEYLYVTLFMFSGVIIYVPFIHYKIFPHLLTKLTVFLQLFLEVAPADKNL